MLGIERWPYSVPGSRAWQLRDSLTVYDAAYVALAQLLDAPLVTLVTLVTLDTLLAAGAGSGRPDPGHRQIGSLRLSPSLRSTGSAS
jgi:predicted nucleic acid-binding protein